ncbi:hypothetical protein V6N13_009360 [Hibiscus sabdariffa]
MERSMADFAIVDDDESVPTSPWLRDDVVSGVSIPNMATSMFLGDQLSVSRLDTNNLASGNINYQGHNHVTKSSSVSTIYVASSCTIYEY